MPVYNQIGTIYNTTRKADPYIAAKIFGLLSPVPEGIYLDIGCGTGNYLHALSNMGAHFYGLDPSDVMLEKARIKNPGTTFILAKAEALPIADGFFNGATAMFTIHHWDDILSGFKELHRVMLPGAMLVLFSFTPEQLNGYWLRHYFPKMIEKSMAVIPSLAGMKELFEQSNFRLTATENYLVMPDLEDHFLYSNKHRPGMYLLPEIRANISSFSAFSEQEEVTAGLLKLEEDIASGAIHTIMKQYSDELGDYLFLVAERL